MNLKAGKKGEFMKYHTQQKFTLNVYRVENIFVRNVFFLKVININVYYYYYLLYDKDTKLEILILTDIVIYFNIF